MGVFIFSIFLCNFLFESVLFSYYVIKKLNLQIDK